MSPEDFDSELNEMIEELVDSGVIDTGMPAYGVAQQIISQGYHSLTAKQRSVYDITLQPALKALATKREVLRTLDSNPD